MRSKEKSDTLDFNKDCTLLHSFMCSWVLCVSTNAAFHPLKMKYTVNFTNSTGPIVYKLCDKILNRTLICDLLEAVLLSASIITEKPSLDL